MLQGTVWWWEHEAAGHLMLLGIRKQQVGECTHACLPPFPHCNLLETLSRELVLSRPCLTCSLPCAPQLKLCSLRNTSQVNTVKHSNDVASTPLIWAGKQKCKERGFLVSVVCFRSCMFINDHYEETLTVVALYKCVDYISK